MSLDQSKSDDYSEEEKNDFAANFLKLNNWNDDQDERGSQIEQGFSGVNNFKQNGDIPPFLQNFGNGEQGSQSQKSNYSSSMQTPQNNSGSYADLKVKLNFDENNSS